MATILGRSVDDVDVAFIRELIAAHPLHSRRGLMLEFARAGYIELPPVRVHPPNPLAQRALPALDRCPPRCRLAELGQVKFRQVRRSAAEGLFNSLIAHHYYRGYPQRVGEHLKYLVYAEQRSVACFAWSSAPRYLGPRDRYIGWTATQRRANIHLVAYNPRFLILPRGEGRASGLAPSRAHECGGFRPTGNGSTPTRCTSRRPSWTAHALPGHATGRRTGCFWVAPRDGARTTTAVARSLKKVHV